jgi:histone deacetylase complex regulatory component SIN3
MEDFQFQRKNIEILKEKITEMSQDRRDLILGFNLFLPTRHEI